MGTLEVGKDGNVLLYSGDPLSVTSHVEHVFIEGRHAYDRDQDVRAKHLLEGQRPPNTAPATPEVEDDDEEEGDGETGGDDR